MGGALIYLREERSVEMLLVNVLAAGVLRAEELDDLTAAGAGAGLDLVTVDGGANVLVVGLTLVGAVVVCLVGVLTRAGVAVLTLFERVDIELLGVVV